MAHPIGQPRGATTTGVVRRRTTIAPTPQPTSQLTPQPNPQPTRQLVEASLPPEPTPSTPAASEAATLVPGASQPAPPVPAAPEPWQIDEPPPTRARTHEEPAPREASPAWRTTAPPPPAPRRITSIGRHRWHAGDLRLAIELLEDASRIPGLDEAARERIDGRLDRLDRFRDAATAELLDLVRDDVHARLVSDAPTIDPDPARTRRIGQLLDELDPRPAGAG
jgi:hypothetical protein